MIVIPMAGESRRFREAGYSLPKYMLDLRGRSLFSHAVASFAAYFTSSPFLFVMRDVQGTKDFVERECAQLGIADVHFVTLDAPTRGQADTVALGLERAEIDDLTALTIFNIDTIRPRFRFPSIPDVERADGALEVFRGAGANWSFVRPLRAGSDRVAETAEKRPISNLCSTGLYRFRTARHFRDAFRAQSALSHGHELYVAPLYNQLIARGCDVRYWIVDNSDVIPAGTPKEYEALARVDERSPLVTDSSSSFATN